MDLTKLIDEEDIMLDSHKLAEFNSKGKLKEDIDDVVEAFIDGNISADDYESITMVYRLADKIKNIL